MSAPRRTPPSKMTGTFFRAPFFGFFAKSDEPNEPATISGNASSAAGAPSSCRPPWFETQSAATPASTALAASSRLVTPFKMIGASVTVLIHLRNDHVNDASRPPTRRESVACAFFAFSRLADRALASLLGVSSAPAPFTPPRRTTL